MKSSVVIVVVLVIAVGIFAGVTWLVAGNNPDLLYANPVTRFLLGSPAGGAVDDLQERLLRTETRDWDVVSYEESRELPSEQDIVLLTSWAQNNGITIVGTSQSPKELYESGYDPSKAVDVQGIPGAGLVANTLSDIPVHILSLLSGKTIYASTATAPPFTIIRGNISGQLGGVSAGFVLPQPITRMGILREMAHIVDFHGIHSMDGTDHEVFLRMRSEYDRLFVQQQDTQSGFITEYAASGSVENFAEHFAHYVAQGRAFRLASTEDAQLAAKYIFFREELFAGQEYD